MKRLLFSLLLFSGFIGVKAQESFTEPTENASIDKAAWSALTDNVQISWASRDIPYKRHEVPALSLRSDTVIYAWKGERIGVEALAFTKNAVKTPIGLHFTTNLPGKQEEVIEGGWLRYVLTDEYSTCGNHPTNLTPWTVAEMLDPGCSIAIPANEVRPMWVSVEIPSDCEAGDYFVKTQVGDLGELNLRVVVVDRQLPAPHDYSFHLDLWQQPYSVSRFYNVKQWSDEHIDLLRPYMKRLARMGQKVVSTILFYEPWGQQSNDKFEPMVATTLKADGSWNYDYEIFDKWVNLMAECGIDEQIDCFSMVPWDMKFRYWDETSNGYKYLSTTTSTAEYKNLWTSFLTDFAKHLKEKGWFEKTCIAMDERGLSDMLNAYNIAQAAVPGIKMALAGNYHQELVDKLYDYCVAYGQGFTANEKAQRRAKGYKSTFYTCCTDAHPGMFSNSNPVDATFLGIYCAADDFDGYLHWSWLNWNDTPLTDTRFFLFAPGDTYFFYPGNRTSLRHERLLEGIQQYEKIRIAREMWTASGETEKLEALNEALKEMEAGVATDAQKVIYQVNLVESILNDSPTPVFHPEDYCEVYLASANKSTAIAKRWLTSVTTSGATQNLNYTASAASGNGVVTCEDCIIVKPGQTFTLKFKATTNDDDIRYCRMGIYADWNNDSIFAVSEGSNEIVAEVGNAKAANTSLLNYSKKITVPEDAITSGQISMLRIVFNDAWGDVPNPCGELMKGFAFNIPMRIVEDTKDAVRQAKTAKIKINGNKVSLPEICHICIYNTSGQLVDQRSSALQYDMSHFTPGIYFIHAKTADGRAINAKVLR